MSILEQWVQRQIDSGVDPEKIREEFDNSINTIIDKKEKNAECTTEIKKLHKDFIKVLDGAPQEETIALSIEITIENNFPKDLESLNNYYYYENGDHTFRTKVISNHKNKKTIDKFVQNYIDDFAICQSAIKILFPQTGKLMNKLHSINDKVTKYDRAQLNAVFKEIE